MAAYISVPRDFSKVKSKVAFNLTARQLICFGAAAVVGVPLFFVLRDTAGNSGATLGMMAVMLPMFFLAMYQKNGQPANLDANVRLAPETLEGSNVNVVDAMVNMISIARQFDMQMKMLQNADANAKAAGQLLTAAR